MDPLSTLLLFLVQPISTALKKCLSTDQQYLAAISLAIQGGPGCFPIELQGKKPGTMHQARWVTTANRILRLYAQETEPSWALRRLASFVLNVYAPSFFTIKTNWDISCAPKNFHSLVSLATSFLTQEEKKVVEPVLVNNSYYAHPENVLLAALTDPSEAVRTSAAQKFVAARDRAASADSQEICRFKVPKQLYLAASTDMDLLDLNNIDLSCITLPPLL